MYWTTAKIIKNLNSKHPSWPTSNTSSKCIRNKEKQKGGGKRKIWSVKIISLGVNDMKLK